MKILRNLFLVFIQAYQRLLSPILVSFGVQCRFEPTCSKYMAEAVQLHGIGVGVGLGLFRLCRCHPLCKGGIDPVPRELIFLKREKNG